MRRFFRVLASVSAVAAIAAIAACSSETERAQSSSQAIFGGDAAAGATNVVAVTVNRGGTSALCSGALIGPNLVLTGRAGCLMPPAQGPTDCTTTFGTLVALDSIGVVTDATVTPTSKAIAVKEVLVTPGTKLCGNDYALLVLADNSAATNATPLAPRFTPVETGELYTEAGYGVLDTMGTGSGVRRSAAALRVECTQATCMGITGTSGDEWLGSGAACSGDSGGPAIDAQGLVIGVASRGPGCGAETVFTRLDLIAGWLKDSAIHAAQVGAYTAPEWATGVAVPDSGVGGASDAASDGASDGAADAAPSAPAPAVTGGGCATSRRAGGDGIAIAIAVCALAARRRRARQ
jgi:secreted trypsin-like serine protease